MRNTIEMLFGSGLVNGTGPEWTKAGSSAAGGGFDTYGDQATIQRDGAIARMWQLHDFKTAQEVAGKSYLSLKTLVEYDGDCQNRRRRTVHASWHAENMAAGAIVLRNDTPSEWMAVVPGSIGEVLWTMACAEAYQS